MSTPVVSNIILLVDDLTRAVTFYRDVLGMAVRASAGQFAFLDGGGVTLTLRAAPADLPAPTERIEVVLEVDDPAATYADWAAGGVEFRIPLRPVTSTDTHDLVAADFRDPDGNLLSLTGWVAK